MPMAEYEAREQELLEQIERLQRALHFWLPSVPDNGPEPICERIGDDAHLLAGLTEADEQDAEELGWITLHPSTSEKQP